jgi:glycosyltransferase involved in cell wall biosynthesis
MAWNLVKRLGQRHRLWVLTAAQNRQAIVTALAKEPLPTVEFVYVDLPARLHPLLRHQGALQLYAYLWQWKAYFVARKLHRQMRFDAFHHLTYENDWMASPTGALLSVPYLRGPGGGAHFVPGGFRARFGAKPRLWEYFRIGMQWAFRHDPFFALGQERAGVLLMANREALEALPRRWRRKARLMSVNGVSLAETEASRVGEAGDGNGSGDDPTTAGGRPARGAPGTNGHAFRVLTAGRLVPIKGFDLAIRAFKKWSQESEARIQDSGFGIQGKTSDNHGSPRAELVIVGEGPERTQLEALARELGLNGQVKFPGWMPRQELLREMTASDVFLFPSLRDGGGLVVVEAMAAGRPVICLDLAGPGLHVTPECGVKVPADSPQQAVRDLAGALDRLYRDARARLQMGRAARQRAREVYDWDRIAERISGIYRDIAPVSD